MGYVKGATLKVHIVLFPWGEMINSICRLINYISVDVRVNVGD